MNDLEIFTNEIQKPVNSQFKRRTVDAYGINDIWSCDLVDLQEFAESNDGYKYLLNIVDVYSKHAWMIPLKSKEGIEVTNAFANLFTKVVPNHLWVDEGNEFKNKNMTALIKKYKVGRYSTFSEHKSAVVERFNRTIQGKLWKYFISHQTRKWIDVIDEITDTYNNTKHSTIKMTPNEALDNIDKLRELHEKKAMKNMVAVIPLFEVGDSVRISRDKGIFEKGYTPNWSTQVFKIYEAIDSNPPTYKIIDGLGEVSLGSFYENELQKTKVPEYVLIEKVIKKRTFKGVKQSLVKYMGYDDKFNAWTNDDDLINII